MYSQREPHACCEERPVWSEAARSCSLLIYRPSSPLLRPSLLPAVLLFLLSLPDMYKSPNLSSSCPTVTISFPCTFLFLLFFPFYLVSFPKARPTSQFSPKPTFFSLSPQPFLSSPSILSLPSRPPPYLPLNSTYRASTHSLFPFLFSRSGYLLFFHFLLTRVRWKAIVFFSTLVVPAMCISVSNGKRNRSIWRDQCVLTFFPLVFNFQ